MELVKGRPERVTDRLAKEIRVYDLLDSLGVAYERVDHEAAMTMAACEEIDKVLQATTCKNLLLCNRQQTAFYLLLLKPLTPFRTAVVSKLLGSSRLSFAPEDVLEELLHLTSGSVSPLGLLFDDHHQITLCYEQAVLDTARIAFHPCDNSATVIFEQKVFWEKVLNSLDVTPVCITLPGND